MAKHDPALKLLPLALAAVLITIGAPARALAAEGSAELAKVNGTSITERDIEAALAAANPGQREALLANAAAKRQLVETLVDRELVYEKAVKEKLDQTEAYKAALANFRHDFLANQLLEKEIGAKVNDAATKKYYEKNKQRYSNDQVHALHILVKDEAKAKEILALAKKPDADFQALAEKYSIDPSAKNNRGDLGFFGRGQMVKEFSEAAFGGSEGEIVGPVRTPFGFHIIKVLEKKLGHPLEFSEVEARVRKDLGQELQETYVGNLRKDAKITVK